jgi:hypothetical protein
MHDNIQKIVFDEISKPSIENTSEVLKHYSVVKENCVPKIERIDVDNSDGSVKVYLPLEKKNFFIVIHIDSETHILSVDLCPGNRIYLSVTSETLSYEQLIALTDLKLITGWNKGEIAPPIKLPRKYSCVVIEPCVEKAYKIEDKLIKFLTYLESDFQNISILSEYAETEIIIVWYGYTGNGCLGGFTLSDNIIHRLSRLNLSIDFDLYTDL